MSAPLSETNQQATQKPHSTPEQNQTIVADLVQQIRTSVGQQIQETFSRVYERIDSISQQSIETHQHLDALAQRANAHEATLTSLNQNLSTVTERMDVVAQRMQILEEEIRQLYQAIAAVTMNINKRSDAADRNNEIPQFQYIMHAADQMNDLIRMAEINPDQERVCFRDSASIACNALRQIAIDYDFRKVVLQLSDIRTRNPHQYREYLQDLEHFKQFLEIERRVLIGGKVSGNLTDRLIEHINELSQELILTARGEEITPEKIFTAVESLSGETCKLAYQLKQQFNSDKAKKRLVEIVIGVAGAGLVVLNLSPDANQVGLNPGGSALSVTIGGILIKRAI